MRSLLLSVLILTVALAGCSTQKTSAPTPFSTASNTVATATATVRTAGTPTNPTAAAATPARATATPARATATPAPAATPRTSPTPAIPGGRGPNSPTPGTIGLVGATPASTAVGTRPQPVEIGGQGFVDDDWSIRIASVDADAWPRILDAISQSQQRSATPVPGTRAILVRLSATYHGAGSAQYDARARLRLLDRANVAFSLSEADCGTLPDPVLPENQQTSTNDSIDGNLCWAVPAGDTDSLLLYDAQASEDRRVFFRVTQ